MEENEAGSFGKTDFVYKKVHTIRNFLERMAILVRLVKTKTQEIVDLLIDGKLKPVLLNEKAFAYEEDTTFYEIFDIIAPSSILAVNEMHERIVIKIS